jgi:hypothetical protein
VSYPPNGQSPRRTNRSQPVEHGSVPAPPQPGPPVPPPQTLPSLEVLHAEFEELVAGNQARFAELAQQGVAPDPFYMVHLRINHLIDAIAAATGPNGPRWATMTRLGFEQAIAAELAQAGPATLRMQLAEGGRYTPGMISQLARQTGTLRRS